MIVGSLGQTGGTPVPTVPGTGEGNVGNNGGGGGNTGVIVAGVLVPIILIVVAAVLLLVVFLVWRRRYILHQKCVDHYLHTPLLF